MWLRSNHILESDPDTTTDQIDTSIWFQSFTNEQICVLDVTIEIEPATNVRNISLQYKCYYTFDFKLLDELAILYQPHDEYPYSKSSQYDYQRGLYRNKEYLERANKIVTDIINEMLLEEKDKGDT